MDCEIRCIRTFTLSRGIMIEIGRRVGFEMERFSDCFETVNYECSICHTEFKLQLFYAVQPRLPKRYDHYEDCPFHPLNPAQTGDRRGYASGTDIIKSSLDVPDGLLPQSNIAEIPQKEQIQQISDRRSADGDIVHQFDRMEISAAQPGIQQNRSPPPEADRRNPVVVGRRSSASASLRDNEWAAHLESPRETTFKDDLTRPEIKKIVDGWNRDPSNRFHFDPGKCDFCEERTGANLLGLCHSEKSCHTKMLCTRCFASQKTCTDCDEPVLYAQFLPSIFRPQDWIWGAPISR